MQESTPVEEFYQGIRTVLDQKMTDNALAQSDTGDRISKDPASNDVNPLLAAVADLPGGVLLRDTTKLTFTNVDRAKTGTVTLPSGATFEAQGGPHFRVKGFDPLAGTDDVGWASATKPIAEGHHQRANLGAELQLSINNSDLNVLKSHGIQGVRAEVEHAVATHSMPPGQLIAFLKDAVARYNATELGKKKPLPVPSTVDAFLKVLDLVNTFDERGQFSKNFWAKPKMEKR